MNSSVAHLEKVVGNHKKIIGIFTESFLVPYLPFKLYLFVLKETRDLSRRQWEIICRIFRLKSSYFYSRIPKVVLDVAAKKISGILSMILIINYLKFLPDIQFYHYY